MLILGLTQPALTELIRGLKDPINRPEGLDERGILKDIRAYCASSGERGTSVKREGTSTGLLPILFHFALIQNTDEGRVQLVRVTPHMQDGAHMRSHPRPQMYREKAGEGRGGLSQNCETD